MTSAERYGLILVSDPVQAAQAPTPPVRAAEASVYDVEVLVPAYSALLFRVAHAVLRNRTEAEDVVQDTFLRVLGHRHKLTDVRDMRVWLVRIAWRLAIDRQQRIVPEQMDEVFATRLVSQHLSAEQALLQTRELQRVLHAIDRLPARERHALLLCAVDEMTPAEISAVLGRSESAVRALVFRARERLKERLHADVRKETGA